jgi:hypothetical protein
MSKKTSIGAKLDAEDYRAFSIIAAQSGTSRSGLLKSLAMSLISSEREKSRKRRTA